MSAKYLLQCQFILLSVVITIHNLAQKGKRKVFSEEVISNPRRMNIPSGEYNEMKYSIYICIEFLLWKELLQVYGIM